MALGQSGDATEVVGLVDFGGVGIAGDEAVSGGFGFVDLLGGIELETLAEEEGVVVGAGGEEEAGEEGDTTRGCERL